jgi:type IV pilus assembly protein PilY1
MKRYANSLKISSVIKGTVFCVLLFAGFGLAQNMETYCCAPPYVVTVVKPNILFTLDMTGSMMWRAGWTQNSGYYDPNRTYYGYFDATVNYYYRSNKFWKEGQAGGAGGSGPFPGNILNWAVMSRVDILRKVMAGGKGQPANTWPKNTLEAEGSGSGWSCYLVIRVSGTNYRYRIRKPSNNSIQISSYWNNVNSPDTADLAAQIPTGTFVTDIDIPPGDPAGMGGVIRQIADKDQDGDFDANAPRLAIQYFSSSSSNFEIAREFWESDGPMAVSAEAFMTDVNNQSPGGATPVAKAVFDAICYLSYVRPNYNAFVCQGRGHRNDPYYTGQDNTLQPVWCRRSFVIILGDGESNSDTPVVYNFGRLPTPYFPRNLYNYDNMDEQADLCNLSGDRDHPGDDYAYYGHITDIRPDLADRQTIDFYSIFCFGQGQGLFQEIAKDGGFNDANGDSVPQVDEYDKDGDGIPDNYYEAEDGSQIEAAIIKIIQDIMAKVSSSSGVSVVTTGTKGSGTTVQAQFYPQRNFPTGEALEWLGTCQGLWLDPYGFLRDDNVPDSTLHLQQDYVITMKWEPADANVMVTRMRDNAGSGDPSQFTVVDTVPVEDLIPIWDGGKWLWNAQAQDRTIYTFVDANQNGIVEAGEIVDFTESEAAGLQPHLGVGSVAAAETVINYIRGIDYDSLRTRTADGRVWKLGDVISSGAVAVQSAIERYDFIYGDLSYVQYYDDMETRRQAVYVGANDGMLHCFNGGIPVELDADPMVPLKLDPDGHELGRELWSYIPYNLLPHLKWLQQERYCHVYYVDLPSYVTDAQIFTPSGIHPQGWGTILIGGMRLGGLPIASAVDTCQSAYFAIDVTDPENPVPMWEFTDDDLALTVCYSCVVKVDDSWFLVFGSGPVTCGGEVTQHGYVYVLDLETGQVLRKFMIPEPASFITNIFGADWGMDYTVDRIYFGTCHVDNGLPGDWGGKIYRILTNDDENPNAWTMTEAFDMERPITAEGSIATDDYNHLWVYFGSGRFFSEVDEIDYTVQRYVGIREDTTRATTVAGLFDVTDIEVDTNDVVHYGGGATSTFEALTDTINTIGGWYRDLEGSGERSLTTSLVFGGAVLFTTFLPTGDICSYGGHGNLFALFYRTGTAYTQAFLASDTSEYRPILIDLGQGMPSAPSLYVSSDQTKVFIQAGGGIVSPETGIPGLPKSGVIIWKGR